MGPSVTELFRPIRRCWLACHPGWSCACLPPDLPRSSRTCSPHAHHPHL